jgi:hypothetical protein
MNFFDLLPDVLLANSERGIFGGFRASCERLLPVLDLECLFFGSAIMSPFTKIQNKQGKKKERESIRHYLQYQASRYSLALPLFYLSP